MKRYVIWVIWFAVLAIFGICELSMSGDCAAAEAQGYTELEFEGHRSWWSCGHGDVVADRYTGRSPNGRGAEIVVCGGVWMKAYTVRIIATAKLTKAEQHFGCAWKDTTESGECK